jgi:formate dehydrogenase maturation protein FdhE
VSPASEESPVPPLSKREASHELAWSPWLRLMLAEIIRKREEREQARAEQLRREAEEGAGTHNQSDPGAGI